MICNRLFLKGFLTMEFNDTQKASGDEAQTSA
jgi:hypothetical protein